MSDIAYYANTYKRVVGELEIHFKDQESFVIELKEQNVRVEYESVRGCLFGQVSSDSYTTTYQITKNDYDEIKKCMPMAEPGSTVDVVKSVNEPTMVGTLLSIEERQGSVSMEVFWRLTAEEKNRREEMRVKEATELLAKQKQATENVPLHSLKWGIDYIYGEPSVVIECPFCQAFDFSDLYYDTKGLITYFSGINDFKNGFFSCDSCDQGGWIGKDMLKEEEGI